MNGWDFLSSLFKPIRHNVEIYEDRQRGITVLRVGRFDKKNKGEHKLIEYENDRD